MLVWYCFLTFVAAVANGYYRMYVYMYACSFDFVKSWLVRQDSTHAVLSWGENICRRALNESYDHISVAGLDRHLHLIVSLSSCFCHVLRWTFLGVRHNARRGFLSFFRFLSDPTDEHILAFAFWPLLFFTAHFGTFSFQGKGVTKLVLAYTYLCFEKF